MCFPSAPPGKPPCLSPVRPLDKGESLAMNANAEQPAQYIEKHGIWIKKKPQTTKNQTKQNPPQTPSPKVFSYRRAAVRTAERHRGGFGGDITKCSVMGCWSAAWGRLLFGSWWLLALGSLLAQHIIWYSYQVHSELSRMLLYCFVVFFFFKV